MSQEITELKNIIEKQAQEIIQLKKMAAEHIQQTKTEFLASISHDIKTPLLGLLGMCEILAQKSDFHIKQKSLQNIKIAIHSLLNLLNSLIEFTQLESSPISENRFSIRDLTKQIITLFKPNTQQKNIKLLSFIDKKIPDQVMGDEIRIYRILLNLVGNAVKFTQAGQITIRLQVIAQEDKHLLLKIKIQDTGIGIPKNKLSLIFSKFYKSTSLQNENNEGYGLGLAIVEKLISDLNGQIEVESQENKGSTFICHLPLKMVSVKSRDNESKIRQKIYHILLVQDNPLAQFAEQNQLEQLRCQVKIAASGQETLQLIKEHIYDCILMDIGLPDMSGYNVTTKIREFEIENKRTMTPIIALSANLDESNQAQCFNCGMQAILKKPFTKENILTLFKKYIKAVKV